VEEPSNWPDAAGITGRMSSERMAGCGRNTQQHYYDYEADYKWDVLMLIALVLIRHLFRNSLYKNIIMSWFISSIFIN